MNKKLVTIVVSMIIIFLVVTAMLARMASNKIEEEFNAVNRSLQTSDSVLRSNNSLLHKFEDSIQH